MRFLRFIFRISIFLVLCLLSLIIQAQTGHLKGQFMMKYDKGQASSSNVVILLFANNNGNSIQQYHWLVTYCLQYRLSKLGLGKVKVDYDLQKTNIEGQTNFRDFDLDSLLIPDRAKVEWHLKDGSRVLKTGVQWIHFGRGVMIIDKAVEYEGKDLTIGFKFLNMNYSSGHLTEIINRATLINHYYGYNKLIEVLEKSIQQKTSGLHPDTPEVFLAEQKLVRLKACVEKHGFVKSLALNKEDPLGFSSSYQSILRLLIRMQSLMKQIIIGEGQKNYSGDKEDFCKGFVAISDEALKKSDELQPFEANSFHEFAALNDTAGFRNLKSACMFYDKHQSRGKSAVQIIYQSFIAAASHENKIDDFVDALLFLDNAKKIALYFPAVQPDFSFQNESRVAIEGMAVAYLSVARSAVVHGNDSMASVYIQKAHRQIVNFENDPFFSTMIFNNYGAELLKLSGEMIANNHYDHILDFLNETGKLTQWKCPAGMEKVFESAAVDLRKHFLLLADSNLHDDYLRRAINFLQKAHQVDAVIRRMLPNRPVNRSAQELAATLTGKLLAKGHDSFERKQYKESARNLLLARELRNIFPGLPVQGWDSLASESLIPYVLSVAQEAWLSIWAHRLPQAWNIYYKVDSLSRYFQIQQNPAVKKTLVELKQKIIQTDCSLQHNKYSNLIVKANQMLRLHHITDAEGLYRKAWLLIRDNSSKNCFKKTVLDSAASMYKNVFVFSKKRQLLTQKMFRQGFLSVLPQYATLDNDYKDYHLNDLRYPYVDLYHFVKSQRIEDFAVESLRYFFSEKKYRESFRYLALLHSWNSDPEKIMTFQKEIAKGYAKKGLEVLKSYSGDAWLKDFEINLEKFRKQLTE